MLRRIIDKIEKMSLIWKKIISFGCIFIIVSSVFLAGSAKSESYVEKTARFLTEAVNKKSGENSFFSLQLVPEDKESENALPRVYDEYFYWKYIFRHSDFSFLATVNGGKTHNCYYSEIQSNKNLSFIYCGNNLNQKNGDYYKHEVYDINLMFKGETKILDGTISFLTISQTMANKLLSIRYGHEENISFTKEDYESLLATQTTLIMDGEEVKFTISNIYFEEGNFFKNTKSVLDEFVISYTIFPEHFEKEYTYVFNKYIYQNYHKLLRIKSIIKDKSFSLRTSEDVLNFSYVKKTLLEEQGNDFLAICLEIVLAIFYFCLMSFFVISKFYFKSINIACLWCAFIVPYLILFFINLVKPIPLFFSFFSLKLYIVYFLLLACLTVYLLYKKGFLKHEKINK